MAVYLSFLRGRSKLVFVSETQRLRLQCQSKKAPAPLNNNINIDEDFAQQTALRSVRWSFRLGVCSVWEVAVLVAESRVRCCHSKKAHQLLLLPGRATGERCCCLFCQLPIASESTWRKGHSNHQPPWPSPLADTSITSSEESGGSVRQGYARRVFIWGWVGLRGAGFPHCRELSPTLTVELGIQSGELLKTV